MSNMYIRSPIRLIEGIPVFSELDFYVKNYDQISGDHLKEFEKSGHNPFMREDHWLEIEKSTEDLIRKYLNPTAKILDVGVGMGRLLERFPNIERYGMDISIGYLKYAKRKGIEVCMSKIEDMPYKIELFDLIVTTDVLEHVLDINLALKKILSVLKMNGVLIIRVPYKEDLSHYLKEDYPYDLVHLRNFDEWSIRSLCEKIFCLQILEYSLTGFVGGPLKYKLPPIPKLQGLIRRIVDASKILGKGTYFAILKRMNQPTEINFVVRKINNECRV